MKRDMKKHPTIVVTGGAGFIGSNLVAALNRRGIEPIVVDHLEQNGAWRNLAHVRFSAYFDRADFLDALRTKQLERPDIIFHLGACSDTRETDEGYLMSNNTLYSKSLFDYCAETDTRFIYASSAATYGAGEHGFDDSVFDLQPINCYGYSKHVFDQWALASADRPPQWAGLKFFNVYGMNEAHKGSMASMVHHGLRQALGTGTIKLFKSYRRNVPDGGQTRDFISVNDVVDVVLFFLDTPGISGIFNVGTGAARTFEDLARAVFAALGRVPHIEYIDMPEQLQAQYQYFTEADTRRLRAAGFVRPFRSLEEGVKEYVEAAMRESAPTQQASR